MLRTLRAQVARGPLVSRSWRAPLAFFAGTWALLTLFRVHAPLHLDTARDLLTARDCVFAGHCHGAGPRSSFGELMQGALWSHLLELHASLGLGLVALERVADLLIAAAAAVVPLVARRLGAPQHALTWALWLPATLITCGYPRLWNPTPWPLVLVWTFLALLQAARTGGAAMFTVAAVALALAVDVHVATGVLVPLFVAVVVACARRPAVALPLAGAAMVAVLALDSPGAFAENRERLGPHAPAIAGGVIAAIVAGLYARRWFAGAGEQRARRVALAVCVHHGAVLIALSLISGHHLDPRYFAPIVTPAALLVSVWLDPRVQRARRPGWWHALAIALVVGWHLQHWFELRGRPQFRLIDVEPIAAELYGRGLAFGDLYRHLRGPGAFDLISVLAALEPADGRRAGSDGPDLLLLRARRDALPRPLPAGWSIVELAGSHVAVIVAYAPWVRSDPLTICRADERDGCEQFPVAVERFAAGTLWTERAYAGIVDVPRRFAGAKSLVYRLSAQVPEDGPARELVLFDDDCGRWSFVGTEARSLPLTPGPQVLEFTVTPRSRCRGWLPHFAEVEVADPSLMALAAAASRERTRH